MGQQYSRPALQWQKCRFPHALSARQLPPPSQSIRFLTTPAINSSRGFAPKSRAPTPPSTATAEQLAKYPYIVRRTPYAQLPVYRRSRSGGTGVLVLIKKIDGDRMTLLRDITESLGVQRESARINPTTQHLELKGKYYDKARTWLLERGF